MIRYRGSFIQHDVILYKFDAILYDTTLRDMKQYDVTGRSFHDGVRLRFF